MIEIIINGKEVKTDEDTVISYNMTTFDLSDLSKRKVDYTNSFKIPIAGNSDVFEFIENPSTTSDIGYDFIEITIKDGAFVVFYKAQGIITDIDETHYNIIVTKKNDIIDVMKDYSLGYTDSRTYIVGGPDTIYTRLLDGDGGYYKADIIWTPYQERMNALTPDRFVFDYRYYNISRYVKDVFDKFSTDTGVTFAGGVFTDVEFEKLRVLCESHTSTATVIAAVLSTRKSFYDLFVEVIKIFAAVYSITNNVITINRFDAINFSNPINFTGKVTKVNSKMYKVNNLGRNNYIRYKPKNNASEILNQVTIPCSNKTLQFDGFITKINAEVYPFTDLNQFYTTVTAGTNIIKVSDKPHVFDDFVFVTDGTQDITISIRYTYISGPSTTVASIAVYNLCTYYNSANDYVRIKSMLLKPEFYEVEMVLTPIDIIFFDPFRPLKIDELGGVFYVNSIKDYLLTKTNVSTKVELIKIP